MTTGRPPAAQRRAARLLRWYPAAWRDRYAAEFAELLQAEFADRPRSWRRAADVARGGLLARLTYAGLTSHQREPASQIQASLATMGWALAAFLTLGGAMLAQLATGRQWGTPHAATTTAGVTVMTLAAGALGLLAVLGGLPVGWLAAAALIREPGRRLAWPAGLLLAGAGALVAGAHHFQNSWPGTGGTAAYHGLLPAGLAAFGWASTLSVSSYWAHPAALQHFPGSELAWMALSPVALACLAAGTAGIARRLPMSAGLLTYLARLAGAGTLVTCCFLAGAACWVFGQGSGQAGLFHAGALDVAGLAVMTAILAVAIRAACSAREASTRLA